MLVYLETGMGATLCVARSVEAAERITLKAVGEINGVSVSRNATKEDVEHIRAMGGKIPTGTFTLADGTHFRKSN